MSKETLPSPNLHWKISEVNKYKEGLTATFPSRLIVPVVTISGTCSLFPPMVAVRDSGVYVMSVTSARQDYPSEEVCICFTLYGR